MDSPASGAIIARLSALGRWRAARQEIALDLQVLNKTLGGDEDNVDPGIKFLAELVKKNEAVIIENTDAAMKGFTREEIVIMPFWNGRTFVLQSQGVPVDIEYIPGTMLVGNGFPVLRGGKFIEQTNRFCNVTMDGQYQTMMTRRFFYPPSNRNAKLTPEMTRYSFPAEKEKNVVPIAPRTISVRR